MVKKISILALAVMLAVSNFLGLTNFTVEKVSAQSVDSEKNKHYEIYPLPQNENYLGTDFSLTDEVNVVREGTIDESTMNFLTKILESKSIQITQSETVVADKTNIIIGTRNSNEYVDSYFKEHIEYDEANFNEIDPYVLRMDSELEQKGTIAILGGDTDSAYYALASLKMIFDQSAGKELKSVMYEDYADTKWRGFIEGFYGFPWSHENRKSLMQFGGEFKMNSYIFGPKDDKYHNSAWRTLYPEDELAKLKELVDVGHESKTQFVWAIHPGFNMINWNNYDAELNTLLAKLDQLYGIGVRQFGLFMDDISTAQSLTDKDKHVRLITDIANWIAAKGDVKSLVYTPPFYNQGWTGATGRPYLEALANVPENVEIMWTGRSVVGTVNPQDMQWPKDAHGRDPYVWLNWPVNDYKDSRLLLGKGEVLQPGTKNISGIVSNPMVQAQLSKIALFAVADFTWNVDDFNDNQSWLDSFKYVEPEVAAELNTVAYHLSDPSPSGHGLVVGESENIKEELKLFLDRFTAGESVEEVGNTLIAEFDDVLNAINVIREESQNEELVKEIEPWLRSLKNVAEAGKRAVLSAKSLQSGNVDAAWENLAIATSEMAESKTHTIKKLAYPDVTVEAGAKRLVPFANELITKLDAQIYTSIDPEAIVPSPITSYGLQADWGNIIDGDDSTLVYIQTNQKNGDWYGIDLGKSIKVNDIRILQGRNNTDHDIFQKGVLEYSADMENWTAIGDERSGYLIDVKELAIEARYVRYRLTHAGVPGGKPDLWTAIREFTINANSGKTGIYTNVAKLKETPVTTQEVTASITNLTNVTLQPSQYIGIQLSSIEQIVGIELDSTATGLTLESSENGVEWQEVAIGGAFPNAAYVRLINKTKQSVTFDLTELSIQTSKFLDPVVSHNYGSVYQGKLEEVYDGKLTNKVWFGGMQDAGKYVQVDMGGLINVENVAVVIGDGEGDYFREGDLQLSKDGKVWETIHTFANPGDRALNFPDHEVPYRYKRVQVDNQQARYVRLISTKTNNVWMALNEIIVNEGLEKPGTENPALKANPIGDLGNEAIQAIDHKLSTFYMPKGDPSPGYMNYKLSTTTKLSEVLVLQSPAVISNAEVSVRDQKGWHNVGKLSQSFNAIDTSAYEHVLEVKIEWGGAVKPQIYEIIAVKKDGDGDGEGTPPVNNAGDMKILVESFEKDGEFENAQTARSLKTHLTAVAQYEKQETADKVVKHMKSFKVLLDNQKASKLISDKAYNALVESAAAVIQKWS
ncbi:beta-N-acetylglucosaminidase domain-containing protein [Sporosarcina sp. NPDC096371]|uniref:beta-N-acetylglucosaminidase domain-containing protein n=1 Tax=Sporosarcina sp. NPDC096371 TaxID=3364530 RepID=UPI0037F821E1